jgi:hypothetical protein
MLVPGWKEMDLAASFTALQGSPKGEFMKKESSRLFYNSVSRHR